MSGTQCWGSARQGSRSLRHTSLESRKEYDRSERCGVLDREDREDRGRGGDGECIRGLCVVGMIEVKCGQKI